MRMFADHAIAIQTLLALVFLTVALGKMRQWVIFQGVVANDWSLRRLSQRAQEVGR